MKMSRAVLRERLPGYAGQALLLAVVAWLVYAGLANFLASLQRLHIASGFHFLQVRLGADLFLLGPDAALEHPLLAIERRARLAQRRARGLHLRADFRRVRAVERDEGGAARHPIAQLDVNRDDAAVERRAELRHRTFLEFDVRRRREHRLALGRAHGVDADER